MKKKVDIIRDTLMFGDQLRKYKEFRRDITEDMRELDKEIIKIMKNKKKRKDK